MRKAVFEVPEEVIGDFSEKMLELELNGSITGKTEDDELEIEIGYEKDDADSVDELEEYLSELISELEEPEEEEEDD